MLGFLKKKLLNGQILASVKHLKFHVDHLSEFERNVLILRSTEFRLLENIRIGHQPCSDILICPRHFSLDECTRVFHYVDDIRVEALRKISLLEKNVIAPSQLNQLREEKETVRQITHIWLSSLGARIYTEIHNDVIYVWDRMKDGMELRRHQLIQYISSNTAHPDLYLDPLFQERIFFEAVKDPEI